MKKEKIVDKLWKAKMTIRDAVSFWRHVTIPGLSRHKRELIMFGCWMLAVLVAWLCPFILALAMFMWIIGKMMQDIFIWLGLDEKPEIDLRQLPIAVLDTLTRSLQHINESQKKK